MDGSSGRQPRLSLARRPARADHQRSHSRLGAVRAGAITKEEIRTHPNQRLHIRSLGAASRLSVPEIDCHQLQTGDRWLLCSDGVTNALDDGDITRLLSSTRSLDEATKRLVLSAHAAGSTDDITAVLISAP